MSYLDKVTVGSTTYDIQDSKAQGDIGDLKSAVKNINGVINVTGAPTVTWSLGNIGSTGTNTSYKNTIRCTYFMARKGSVISAESGYVIRVYLYATTDDSTFISRSDFVTSYQFTNNYKARLLVTDTAHTDTSSGNLPDTSYSAKVNWSDFVLKTIDEQIAPVIASDVPGMAVKLDRLYPYNLWNYGTYSENKSLNANTGAIANDEQYDTTDFIPVTPGEIIYGRGARFWCYDSGKTIVSGATGILNNLDTEIGYSNHYYTIPENAAYFRICIYKSNTEHFLAKVNALEYLLMTKTDGLPGENERKKIYAIGDSITRGMYTSIGDTSSSGPTQYGYPYWIGKINSFDVVNLGESGGGYALKGTQTNSNGKDIVDSNTFDDADIITIALGVNDYKGSGVTLGSMESTAGDGSTIGNMKYMIETLADPVNGKAKKAQIIVLLPMNENRFSQGTLATNWAFGYAFHEDKTLTDYRNAIRECAEYYNVKVVDLEEVCPINRLNIRNVLGDGLHPTIAFYKQMGQALAQLIH